MLASGVSLKFIIYVCLCSYTQDLFLGRGLKCYICQDKRIQDAVAVRNTSGSYISYLNFGFCKNGKEVGNLEECRYGNTGELQTTDVTPFCGYYILGGLHKTDFNQIDSKDLDHNKIVVFKKLFDGLEDEQASHTEDGIQNQLMNDELKDHPFFLGSSSGVIRGCFGARQFNVSSGEARRGPGCHSIWGRVNINMD